MLATVAIYRRNWAVYALVIVRWVTDRRAFLVNNVGTSRQLDRQNASVYQSALRFERFGFANACSAPLFSACSARRKRNRPAVGYPPYVADAFSYPIVGLMPTIRSPTHKPPHFVGSKLPSLTSRECVYDLTV
ncbi:MAG: hypothetical protein LBQ66_05590 [Planctomycetaceae bacterium]|nr:hypothetical protein [Planctomycetaceae bacterium]